MTQPMRAEAWRQGALAALRRAAQRARMVAAQTGTDLIVHRAGAIVRVKPRNYPEIPDSCPEDRKGGA
jgi:hypothetical protein